jgi:hypothetical protein
MLVDHLKHGGTIDDFLESASSVIREQAELFLELASEQLVECVSPLVSSLSSSSTIPMNQ